MARGGGRGLATPGMRARVALVTELPIDAAIADGSLALALASRRDLAREWIAVPSTGSLPSRRLAARLLERAAREAATRAARGDEHSLRVFTGDIVAPAWDRLLADRESLVWRHVAVARGLLSPWMPALAEKIEGPRAFGLADGMARAAASIAASVAVAPEAGLRLSARALADGILKRDPGAGSAFIWGLPRAGEAEPDAAIELLDRVLDAAPPDIGEAVLDLRTELGRAPIADRAAERVLALMTTRGRESGDDGADALALDVARDLEQAPRDDLPVRVLLARALRDFATSGAKEAYASAREALSAARGSVDALEAVSHDDGEAGRTGSMARRTTLAVLRDLDVSLLEHDVLAHLLSLGEVDTARGVDDALDVLRDRLGDWILQREGAPLEAGERIDSVRAHPTLSLRRLRALLHLADGPMGDDESDPLRAIRLRRRCWRIARALLDRFERGPASPVRRTIVAALARALDALVRGSTSDPIDALLVVARYAVDPVELGTIAEASMDPDLVHVFLRYASFADAVARDETNALAALDVLTRDLALDDSSRSEALRAVLVRLGSALAAIAAAPSLRSLGADLAEPEVISTLETALGSLSQLAVGARGRLDPERPPGPVPSGMHPLSVAIARVLAGKEEAIASHVVAASLDALLGGVPRAIAKVVAAVVWRLVDLPREGGPNYVKSLRVAEPLPSWLTPRRTIGGFYVIRALSAGAVGSVFIATRAEDKGNENAERFALKVPEYSATAARSLSEAEFLKMFSDEAAALMLLPKHPNIARFVTFDAACKPKPVLVMELVEGTTLERLLQTKGLDAPRVLRLLDGVLGGLEAMHATGIGHLDLKPANVVLRRDDQAVLVDFGLAGKRVRPGCATGPYGSPEVWGALEGRAPISRLQRRTSMPSAASPSRRLPAASSSTQTRRSRKSRCIWRTTAFPNPSVRSRSVRTAPGWPSSSLQLCVAIRPIALGPRQCGGSSRRCPPRSAARAGPSAPAKAETRCRCLRSKATRIRTAAIASAADAAVITAHARFTCSRATTRASFATKAARRSFAGSRFSTLADAGFAFSRMEGIVALRSMCRRPGSTRARFTRCAPTIAASSSQGRLAASRRGDWGAWARASSFAAPVKAPGATSKAGDSPAADERRELTGNVRPYESLVRSDRAVGDEDHGQVVPFASGSPRHELDCGLVVADVEPFPREALGAEELFDPAELPRVAPRLEIDQHRRLLLPQTRAASAALAKGAQAELASLAPRQLALRSERAAERRVEPARQILRNSDWRKRVASRGRDGAVESVSKAHEHALEVA